MKILLLEGNTSINNLITKKLTSKGYEIDNFLHTKAALASIDNGYSCFILGISKAVAPKSLKILKCIRDFYPQTPVVMLHVENDLDIKTIRYAYEQGCDDFLKKPFLVDELESKLSKLLNIRHDIVSLGPQCSFDFKTGLLNISGTKRHLSKKEHRLFCVLFSHKDTIVSYETIKAQVWGDEYVSLDSIRSLIRRLRQKIPFTHIETFLNSGYMLRVNSPQHHNSIGHENYKKINLTCA